MSDRLTNCVSELQRMGKQLGEVTAERDHLRGAMGAQDERERIAGEACGVPWTEHDCDWPQWVAETVNQLRADLAAAQAREQRLRGFLARTIRMVEQLDEGITTEEWADLSEARAALADAPAAQDPTDWKRLAMDYGGARLDWEECGPLDDERHRVAAWSGAQTALIAAVRAAREREAKS